MKNIFLNTFEPELLEEIMNFPSVVLPKGETILKEESYIKQIPLVVYGNIKVRKTDENGKELILYHILPGESCVLSITSCLNNKQSNAEAITEDYTEIRVIPSEKVKEWMDKYKSWRNFVLKLYYDRMFEILNLVDGISFKQTDNRLIEKLNDLRKKEGNTIKITHQQLANEIGTAREVISRLLKKLEKEEYIKLERGSIKILQNL